jgi:hypothetical protein
MWAGGDNSRILSVKNLDTTIVNMIGLKNIFGWRRHLWFWKIPLKINFFTWLTIETKIPTWDILKKKGWTGPTFAFFATGMKRQLSTYSLSAVLLAMSGTGSSWKTFLIQAGQGPLSLHASIIGSQMNTLQTSSSFGQLVYLEG